MTRVDACEPELFHEPVLERLVGGLDPALGRRGVGADHIDVQLAHRPTEWRQPGARVLLAIDPEDAGLVAVEGDGAAVLLEVAAHGREVLEGRLGAGEAQLHELARRVVDEDQEHAAPATVLEPVVLGAVDLHELAAAHAPVAGRVHASVPQPTRRPEAVLDHPLGPVLVGSSSTARSCARPYTDTEADIPNDRVPDSSTERSHDSFAEPKLCRLS